jgi:hypothetical protein
MKGFELTTSDSVVIGTDSLIAICIGTKKCIYNAVKNPTTIQSRPQRLKAYSNNDITLLMTFADHTNDIHRCIVLRV